MNSHVFLALHCPLRLLKFCCECCSIFRFSPCKVSAQSYLLKWSCDLVVSWSEILEQIDSMSSSSLRVLIMYLTVCPCLGTFVNTSNQSHKLHTAHSSHSSAQWLTNWIVWQSHALTYTHSICSHVCLTNNHFTSQALSSSFCHLKTSLAFSSAAYFSFFSFHFFHSSREIKI